MVGYVFVVTHASEFAACGTPEITLVAVHWACEEGKWRKGVEEGGGGGGWRRGVEEGGGGRRWRCREWNEVVM